jgi:BirA family transcriptional regulator, biotin operon repressor / biotin---[acetyl-CoA-carboxylase] ligase
MIIGSKIIFISNLPSTNSHAAQLLKREDPPEGTIIYTNYQSEGRGQGVNSWESEDGKNLLISIIFSPVMINPVDQFLISIIISLGICDFLKRYIPVCSIKWPNDIYVNNDKIAGILIENTIMGGKIENTIAGIGININQHKFTGDAPNPVSLGLITGMQYEIVDCVKQLASDIDKRYKELISGNHSLQRNEYVSMLYRHNEWCKFRDSNGSYTGRIKTVSDSGLLSIENQTGRISEYDYKEVEYII